MPHPKDDELIPVGTVVRIKVGANKGKKARIDEHVFRNGDRDFMYYLGAICKPSNKNYCLLHDELEVIS